MAVRKLNPREKFQTIELRPLTTGAGKTDALDIAAYPTSALQVIAENPVGLVYDVEISNVDIDSSFEDVPGGTAVTAGKLFFINQGVALVRVNVTALTSGRVGVIWNGALQS